MSELANKTGSWPEYRRLVLQVLEDLETRVSDLEGNRNGDGVVAEGVRKDLSALKRIIFGDDGHDSLEVRMDRLEEFRKTHPALLEKTASGEVKVDKKMLFLLLGAISGLVGLLKMAFEVIQGLLGKS